MAEIEYITGEREGCPPCWPDLETDGFHFSFYEDEMEDWYEKEHPRVVVEIVSTTSPTEARFLQLRKEWIRGTEKLSRLSEIVLHPAYQQIIAMGSEAIPFILKSLERQTDHWFWALKMLNKGKDVAEGIETMEGAASAWLKWGTEQGYLDTRE
ncbi:MAG: hypothetical protein ACLQM6_02695 [Acidobacteriaceae bacterium]